MKTINLIIPSILVAVGFLVGAYMFQQNIAVGSVSQGSEYSAVGVISTTGTTSPKTIAGTLGSVVVSKTGTAGEIIFYHASTTATSTATSTATRLFTFDGTADEGTYTFDIGFGQGGLLIEENAYDGEAVVTWR